MLWWPSLPPGFTHESGSCVRREKERVFGENLAWQASDKLFE